MIVFLFLALRIAPCFFWRDAAKRKVCCLLFFFVAFFFTFCLILFASQCRINESFKRECGRGVLEQGEPRCLGMASVWPRHRYTHWGAHAGCIDFDFFFSTFVLIKFLLICATNCCPSRALCAVRPTARHYSSLFFVHLNPANLSLAVSCFFSR